MADWCSNSLEISGKGSDVKIVLEGCKEISCYDKEVLVDSINKTILSVVEKGLGSEVCEMLSFGTGNTSKLDFIKELAEAYPKVKLTYLVEKDGFYAEYKLEGKEVKEVSFDNLTEWRVYTKDLELNEEAFKSYITNELDWMIEQYPNFNDYIKAVFEEFEKVLNREETHVAFDCDTYANMAQIFTDIVTETYKEI